LHFHTCSAELLFLDETYKHLITKVNQEKEFGLASVGIIMDSKVIKLKILNK